MTKIELKPAKEEILIKTNPFSNETYEVIAVTEAEKVISSPTIEYTKERLMQEIPMIDSHIVSFQERIAYFQEQIALKQAEKAEKELLLTKFTI